MYKGIKKTHISEGVRDDTDFFTLRLLHRGHCSLSAESGGYLDRGGKFKFRRERCGEPGGVVFYSVVCETADCRNQRHDDLLLWISKAPLRVLFQPVRGRRHTRDAEIRRSARLAARFQPLFGAYEPVYLRRGRGARRESDGAGAAGVCLERQ